jgi:osmotically inducible lipoprotein OsmB
MVLTNTHAMKAYFLKKGIFMYILNRKNQLLASCAIVVLLASCSGMSSRDKSTAIGAGVGAVGGAVLTGGGVLGTVGGAAVGGVIGNQVGKDKKK